MVASEQPRLFTAALLAAIHPPRPTNQHQGAPIDTFIDHRRVVLAVVGLGAGLVQIAALASPPSTEPPVAPIAVEKFTRLDAETLVRSAVTDDVTASITINREGMEEMVLDVADLSNVAITSFTVQPGARSSRGHPPRLRSAYRHPGRARLRDRRLPAKLSYAAGTASSIPAAARCTRRTTRPTARPSWSPRSSRCRPTDRCRSPRGSPPPPTTAACQRRPPADPFWAAETPDSGPQAARNEIWTEGRPERTGSASPGYSAAASTRSRTAVTTSSGSAR